MADYIRGTSQFENAHMVGRSDAWRDGYLSVFYGRDNEACEGKSDEYIKDFEKGYRHQYETSNMLAWANKLRKKQL